MLECASHLAFINADPLLACRDAITLLNQKPLGAPGNRTFLFASILRQHYHQDNIRHNG